MFNRFNNIYNSGNRYQNSTRVPRTPRTPRVTHSWTGQQVFAAAVMAQDVNGEYVKYDQFDDTGELIRTRNRKLMLDTLAEPSRITESALARAEQVRQHFQMLLFNRLGDQLNGFQEGALRVSTREEFTNADQLDLAIVASLPASYTRDLIKEQELAERQAAAANSQHVGRLGERISGVAQILSCVYSVKWNMWVVNARINENVFFFFLNHQVTKNQCYQVRGTIKAHRPDNITQLNRVRVQELSQNKFSDAVDSDSVKC